MTDAEETAYEQGSRMAWLFMFQKCLTQLGYDSIESAKSTWVIEREEIVHQLRSVCRDFGDNDWKDDLNLADVIDKHLAEYLYSTGKDNSNV